MQFTLDNVALPLSGFVNVGLGYLLGLGFIGYMAVWTWIKERGVRSSWPTWFTGLLVGLHFLLGLTAIAFIPAALLHRLKSQGAINATGAVAFLVTIIVVLGVAGLIAKDWKQLFRDRQSKK